MVIANAKCTVSQNTFWYNEATGFGGLLSNEPSGSALGILGLDETYSAHPLGSLIGGVDNQAVDFDALVVNNLFARNETALAHPTRSAVWLHADGQEDSIPGDSSVDVNVSFVNNTMASTPEHLIGVYNGVYAPAPACSLTLTIENSILWDGQTPTITPDVFIVSGLGTPTITARASILELSAGITIGGKNLSTNPLFLNPAVDDYRLTVASPAVNSGVNAYWSSVLGLDGAIRNRDRSGGVRIVGSAIDRGCFERNPNSQ
ncbi:MAG: hypothetical protein ACKVX7_20180 [Planctomycetota bacterium]